MEKGRVRTVGIAGKAPQLNSKQISANYLTLIMLHEPAMRVSKQREGEAEGDLEDQRDLLHVVKGFLSPPPFPCVYIILESCQHMPSV